MYPIECYPCWFIDSLSPCDVGLYGIMFRIQKLSRHRSRFCMRPILGLLRAPFISRLLTISVRICVLQALRRNLLFEEISKSISLQCSIAHLLHPEVLPRNNDVPPRFRRQCVVCSG